MLCEWAMSMIRFTSLMVPNADEVSAVGVAALLGRFRHRAFHILDTCCIFYYSHSLLAILVHVPKLRFSSKYSDALALTSTCTTLARVRRFESPSKPDVRVKK